MRAVYWGLVKSQIQHGKKVEDVSQLRCWEPTVIPNTQKLEIVSVALGSFYYILLTRQGEVYSFGTGANGRLGSGNNEDVEIPTKIKFDSKIVSITAGYTHACAIDEEGRCFIWGSWTGSKQHDTHSPKLVPFTKKIIKIACGQHFSAFIDEDSHLYMLGSNRFGKCGKPSKQVLLFETPEQIILGDVSKFRDVALGCDFSVAVSVDGELFTWGNNECKQCGVEKKQLECSPTKLMVSGEKFIQASCSKGNKHCHAAAVTESKTVYVWGDNYKYKLGMETSIDLVATPTKIPFFDSAGCKIAKIECGGIHTFFMTEDHSLYCCGCGSDGRLGFPEAKEYRYLFKEKQPRLLESLKTNVQDICSAYYTNVALLLK